MKKYERHSIVSLEEGLEFLRLHNPNPLLKMDWRDKRKPERHLLSGVLIKPSSLRLRTFLVHGTKCIECGLEASFFAIEKDFGIDVPYHLNLYGKVSGGERLFTHDHILARSLGGADNIHNTQTMCKVCNSLKGKSEQKLAELRRK